MFSSGFAIASSTFDDNKLHYGPNLAIDGKYSIRERETGFYKSHSKDQNPWHMTVLRRPIYLAAVRIYNIRNDSKYVQKMIQDMPRNVTVHAGTFQIEANFSDVSDLLDSVTNKTICGSHSMPGEDGGIYTINCQEKIKADVIIIQPTRSGGNESLLLDEVEFLREGTYHES